MFKHVAMEQPESWIICNKDQIRLLTSLEQIGITLPIKECSIFSLYPKVVAVKVHGVVPAGIVPDLNADYLAAINLR